MRYYTDLILTLTQKEIKVKYKKSFLGYLWSLLNPLSMAVIYYFAFKMVLKIPIESFTLYLITGLFPWQWFSNSVASSSVSLLGNASLIKKVNFPRYFIPLSNVLNDAFHFALSLPVIVGFVLLYKIHPTLEWIYGIPLTMLSQFLITYGFSLFMSSVNLFFRDLEKLVGIFLNILFYATPIIYTSELIPKEVKNYMLLNPMYAVVEEWHLIFMKGTFDWWFFAVSLSHGLIIFFVGFVIFKKLSWRFAEVL